MEPRGKFTSPERDLPAVTRRAWTLATCRPASKPRHTRYRQPLTQVPHRRLQCCAYMRRLISLVSQSSCLGSCVHALRHATMRLCTIREAPIARTNACARSGRSRIAQQPTSICCRLLNAQQLADLSFVPARLMLAVTMEPGYACFVGMMRMHKKQRKDRPVSEPSPSRLSKRYSPSPWKWHPCLF